MIESIKSVRDIKMLDIQGLKDLCKEARTTIKQTVDVCGGHLSSNLGVVELTVALYYVFDLPEDKLIFDVGHQCYTHKLLSGRYNDFSSLRQANGISGFPKREESEYDAFNTGHAGTSVSAALGIAKARDLKSENFNVINILGDGSLENGLIYEAFNNMSTLNTHILTILNDNGLTISPTVGGMYKYLNELKDHKDIKNYFELFGYKYIGISDGNDIETLIKDLIKIKPMLQDTSVLFHVITQKGKGYEICEKYPDYYHGVSANCEPHEEYSKELGKTLCEMAEKNDKIVAVTAAMTSAMGLDNFFEKYSSRSIDVGICEAHAVTMSAGLAVEGFKPYVAMYSTFLQRGFDEVLHDVCSQNLPVTFCIDRAGITGNDGETHQGVYDLSYLSLMPNMSIATPKDIIEFKQLLKFSETFNAPLAIRYPRTSKKIFDKHSEIDYGKAEVLKSEDSNVCVLACGEKMLSLAYEIYDELKENGKTFSIINFRFVKPIDNDILKKIKSKYIITMEDNAKIGGFGDMVVSRIAKTLDNKVIKKFAYDDSFIAQGEISDLTKMYGIDKNIIKNYILEKLKCD